MASFKMTSSIRFQELVAVINLALKSLEKIGGKLHDREYGTDKEMVKAAKLFVPFLDRFAQRAAHSFLVLTSLYILGLHYSGIFDYLAALSDSKDEALAKQARQALKEVEQMIDNMKAIAERNANKMRKQLKILTMTIKSLGQFKAG